MKIGKILINIHTLFFTLLAGGSIFLLFYLSMSGTVAIHWWFRIILLIAGGFLMALGGNITIKAINPLINKIGIAPGILGITILALGSALPDLIFSIGLSTYGYSDIATYVIVGSNVATILLVGGIAARMAYINYSTETLMKEILIAITSTIVLLLILHFSFKSDGLLTVSQVHGVILLISGCISLRVLRNTSVSSLKQIRYKGKSQKGNFYKLALGLGSVLIGATCVLIVALESIHHSLIPIHLLGSGLLALCLSLPELTFVYFACKYDHESVALGTVLGSNSINVYRILGIIILMKPFTISTGIYRDICFLMMCQILLLFTIKFNKHHALYHLTGMLLMLLYLSYLFFLVHK